MRLLARREHSRAELERKLAAFEELPGTLAQALDDLQAKDFINEQRVVDSVVHRRAPRLGAGRVRQELERKGLDREAIASAVTALASTELARASAVWKKKFGGESTTGAADRHARCGFWPAGDSAATWCGAWSTRPTTIWPEGWLSAT